MNIRKAFLVVLILAIASVGLTLTGCEKKHDHPAGEAKACCGEDASKCCGSEAAEGVKEEAEKTATEPME